MTWTSTDMIHTRAEALMSYGLKDWANAHYADTVLKGFQPSEPTRSPKWVATGVVAGIKGREVVLAAWEVLQEGIKA